MEHIRITTKKLIKDWKGKRHISKEKSLRGDLRQIFTKQEQRHIKYYSVKDSRVTLGVDSSAWLYMLNLKKRQLLQSLNQILKPKEEVIDILLQLDTAPQHNR